MNYKWIFLSFFLIITLTKGYAQERAKHSYSTAVGIKFYPESLTLKHFMGNHSAVEVQSYFWKGTRLVGLYEKYTAITDMKAMTWYVGAGAHISMYDRNSYEGKSFLGADGIVGIDYKIKNVPINLSLDWQPSIEFGGGVGFAGNWGGLGIRYILE